MAGAVLKSESKPFYGWEEPGEDPYQQNDTTPITSAIVKQLAHTEIPLTTSELWDRVKVYQKWDCQSIKNVWWLLLSVGLRHRLIDRRRTGDSKANAEWKLLWGNWEGMATLLLCPTKVQVFYNAFWVFHELDSGSRQKSCLCVPQVSWKIHW